MGYQVRRMQRRDIVHLRTCLPLATDTNRICVVPCPFAGILITLHYEDVKRSGASGFNGVQERSSRRV